MKVELYSIRLIQIQIKYEIKITRWYNEHMKGVYVKWMGLSRSAICIWYYSLVTEFWSMG